MLARICPNCISGRAQSPVTLLLECPPEDARMHPELQIWLNHFEYHAQHPRSIPSGLPDGLTGAERRLIAGSLATFQVGEHSLGRTLICAARRFAHTRSMPELERIVELLIREERRHADLLRDFMTDHFIPVRDLALTDLAFRAVRRLAGFELYLHVLIAAELIGNVYYRALETVTGCQRLKVLCRTLVADELAHVAFESELLRELRTHRPPVVQSALRFAHRTFFTCATLVVWSSHHAVLRAAGYRRARFARVCHAQYAFYLGSGGSHLKNPQDALPATRTRQ